MGPKSGELNSCPRDKKKQRQGVTETAMHEIIKTFVTVNQNRNKRETKQTNKNLDTEPYAHIYAAN